MTINRPTKTTNAALSVCSFLSTTPKFTDNNLTILNCGTIYSLKVYDTGYCFRAFNSYSAKGAQWPRGFSYLLGTWNFVGRLEATDSPKPCQRTMYLCTDLFLAWFGGIACLQFTNKIFILSMTTMLLMLLSEGLTGVSHAHPAVTFQTKDHMEEKL